MQHVGDLLKVIREVFLVGYAAHMGLIRMSPKIPDNNLLFRGAHRYRR
jgi:hypothetical protein